MLRQKDQPIGSQAEGALWRSHPHSRLDDSRKLAGLCEKSEAEGGYLLVFDSLIAATASYHGMAIMPWNVTDFESCSEDLNIFNLY